MLWLAEATGGVLKITYCTAGQDLLQWTFSFSMKYPHEMKDKSRKKAGNRGKLNKC